MVGNSPALGAGRGQRTAVTPSDTVLRWIWPESWYKMGTVSYSEAVMAEARAQHQILSKQVLCRLHTVALGLRASLFMGNREVFLWSTTTKQSKAL